MPTLSRSNIVERVRHDSGLTRSEAKSVVDSLVELMRRTLCTDGRLLISGFGVFQVSAKGARPARNPGTGEVVMLPPYRAVTFSISRKLRDALNEDLVRAQKSMERPLPPTLDDMLSSGRPGMILRAHRQQRGMTQIELAKAVGILQRRVSEIENGVRPIGEDLARRLGDALGTDWTLYVGKDRPQGN